VCSFLQLCCFDVLCSSVVSFMCCRESTIDGITGQILDIIKKGEIVGSGSYFNLYEDGFDDVYLVKLALL